VGRVGCKYLGDSIDSAMNYLIKHSLLLATREFSKCRPKAQ